MKNVKWFFPVIVALFGIVSLSSCYDNFDEEFDGQEQFDDNDNDNSPDDDNTGSNTGGTGGGGNTGGAELDPDGGIAIYQIDGQNIIKADSKNVSPSWMNDDVKHQDIWEMVTSLIPVDQRRWMTTFEIFDGGQELLGYVYNSTDDLTSWNFALGIDSAYPDGENLETTGDFVHTIIHEYGHIFALNDEQLNPAVSSCDGYNPGEGCAYENSYIGAFHQRFWVDIAAEHAQVGEENSYEIYEKYPDRFVSEYAATNPAEDIAEVFAHFITSDSAPSGNQIKDEKVRFLYEYPELVNLRNHMRSTNYALPAPGSWKRPKCRGHKHNYASM